MNAIPIDLQLAGSVDDGSHYTVAVIREILDADRTELSRGTQFIGRPGTRIHCQNGHVVKIREDLALKPETAIRWVQHALKREQDLGVHHPHKTWFLDHCGDDVIVGNVVPELRPLHTELAGSSDTDWCLEQLASVVELYAQAVSGHNLRLDEGLSNFGLDDVGQLYYLDDEIYRWDRFMAFSQTLGVYLRSLEQLDSPAAERLGARIAEVWTRHYPDPHCPQMIARLVRDIPVVGPDQESWRDALVTGLEGATKGRKRSKKRETSVHRVARAKRVALLADVHSNAPALTATLEALRERGIKDALVLGDVVGYGPHPGDCIRMLQEAGFPIVKGNHDHATASGFSVPGTNKAAKWAIDWTREVLSEAELDWLAGLPNYLHEEGWLAVHGAPMDPNYFYGYVYRATASNNLDYLQTHGIGRCFHGHSHMAAVYFRDADGRDGYEDEDQDVSGYLHSLICPGSIGKTRSGSPGAEFAVLDLTTGSLEMVRVDYALDDALGDMESLGFPEVLRERLRDGM
jgi:predicted phosphodiesterase